jgi:hypothetical protein
MRHSLASVVVIRFAARRIELLIFMFAVALFLAAHAIARISPELYRELNKADSGGGALEYIQALLYFAAFTLGVTAARRAFRSPTFWPLALFSGGVLFVFGEEIGWGQYLIGIDVPELFQIHNQQGDMTLHNLNWIEDRHLHRWAFFAVGLYGSLAWLTTPYLPRRLLVLVPPWFLVPYFMVCMAYYGHKLIANFPFPHLVAKQEASETFLAFGVFFLAVVNLYRCVYQESTDAECSHRAARFRIRAIVG